MRSGSNIKFKGTETVQNLKVTVFPEYGYKLLMFYDMKILVKNENKFAM